MMGGFRCLQLLLKCILQAIANYQSEAYRADANKG